MEQISKVLKCIGTSDIAALIFVGCGENGIQALPIKFHADGVYFAQVLEDEEIEVNPTWERKAEFTSWLKIYDDTELTFKSGYAKKITVYQTDEDEIIIHMIR